MAGRSPVSANGEQRRALVELGRSRDRAEADRARAILLTLAGWTSPDIAAAFGVREDTVRLWRSAFAQGGVEALRTRGPPGPAPVKAERALVVAGGVAAGAGGGRPARDAPRPAPGKGERALVVAEEVLAAPVADRPNRTLPRLVDEIERRSGLRISRSRLPVGPRGGGGGGGG